MSIALTAPTGILLAVILVLLNGFFVAAEFALVKLRLSQVDQLVVEGRTFSRTAQWLLRRLDRSLSACQLGITMASLGLGWVGEPAFARLLEPALGWLGITSVTMVHGIAFVVAFMTITSLHLVIGEQVPKIYALRQPENLALKCAVPLKFFYVILFPLTVGLNAVTAFLLRALGVVSSTGHETPHTEEEIQELLKIAHSHGNVSSTEQYLIRGVFQFDDMICRRVMVPRGDVEYFDINRPMSECLELVKTTRHTRYPVCNGSLDETLGFLHIKDLVGVSNPESLDLKSILRPPQYVPESMRVSLLLRKFQVSHQLMALVVDEYGMVSGIVTLENVLEPISGSIEDEFDIEEPEIVPDGPGCFIVLGGTDIGTARKALGLSLQADDVDTMSGLLMARLNRVPVHGDLVDIGGATAEVLETKGHRATRVVIRLDREGTG